MNSGEHNMKRLSNIIRCFVFIINTIWINKKVYFIYNLIEIFNKSALLLAIVMLPGLIINQLTMHNIQQSIILAIIFCSVTFCNEIISLIIGNYKSLAETVINEKMTEDLGLKIMNIRYELLEQKETLDEYHFALKCIERNSLTKFGGVLSTFISSLITLAGVLYIVSKLNILIIALMVIVVVVSALGEVYRLRYVYERAKEESNVKRNLYYARNDLVTKEYAKEIRLYNLSDFIENKVRHYAEILCGLWTKAAYKSIKAVSWTYVLKGIQLAIVNGYIAILCLRGIISIGQFAIYVTAINTLSLTSISVVNTFITIGEESKYIEELLKILSYEVPKGKGIKDIANKPLIRFENVSYKYPNRDTYALRNITLDIVPNRKYALVGENGAGKTTFIKLLLGYYTPCEGRILVGGIPQQDIDKDVYNKLFATVFQDFNILGFSLEENIAMDSEIDYNKLKKCISDLGMTEKIATLDNKTKTYMTNEYHDSGTELSGGEKQKLAIARALYKDAEMFILDEPTAALSPQSEYKLYDQFRQLTYEKTVLYISHRLSSCRLCDEIYVFKEGKLIEKGAHEELIELRGDYATMFNLQAKPYQKQQVI